MRSSKESPTTITRFLGRARRFSWQRNRFVMYRLLTSPASEVSEDPGEHPSSNPADVCWIGLNGFARVSDPELPVTLSAYGETMRARGDSALLACSPQHQLVGWVWVRTGRYLERAGCGFLEIPQSVHVVRDFKVHPEVRGRGLGHALLEELGRRFLFGCSSTTIAFVAPDNVPSIRSFERAGFARVATVDTRRIAGVRLATTLPLPAAPSS